MPATFELDGSVPAQVGRGPHGQDDQDGRRRRRRRLRQHRGAACWGRGAAAADPRAAALVRERRGLSASPLRRRREPSPRTIHLAPAASPRPVISTSRPRRRRDPASAGDRHSVPAASPRPASAGDRRGMTDLDLAGTTRSARPLRCPLAPRGSNSPRASSPWPRRGSPSGTWSASAPADARRSARVRKRAQPRRRRRAWEPQRPRRRRASPRRRRRFARGGASAFESAPRTLRVRRCGATVVDRRANGVRTRPRRPRGGAATANWWPRGPGRSAVGAAD